MSGVVGIISATDASETKGRTIMGNESMENQVWSWLEGVNGWVFSGSEHEKEFAPSIGIIPSALALVLGDQEIYFATGEVKARDNANMSREDSVNVTFIAEKGLYRITGVVGRNFTNERPVVTWHPLSVITSMRVETDKNWWHENPYYYLSVTLETSTEGTIKLDLPRRGRSRNDALVKTVQFLQGAGVTSS